LEVFMSTKTIVVLSALAIGGCSSDTGTGAKDLAMQGGADGGTNGSDGGNNNADLAMSNGGDGGARVPLNHRPDDGQCQAAAPPGTCQVQGAPGDCSKDADCINGKNGRCFESNGGALHCTCSYDTCTHDSDCTSQQTCACHGSAYLNGDNVCVPGNCHVDANCPGSYCSPSYETSGCGGLAGYYCHTAGDTCIDDTDCGNNGIKVCAYSATDKKWECAMRMFCP
jgi:hypothetical protein